MCLFKAGYTWCVCVYGELALHTMYPFKAGYTWCVCMVNWPYTPCVLSKQVLLGVCVCVVNSPYRPCVLSKQVILGACVWLTRLTDLVSFQSRLYLVCLGGELALQTLCPFKAGYNWCMCVG